MLYNVLGIRYPSYRPDRYPRLDNREGWRTSHEGCIVGGERGKKMKIQTDNKQTHHDEVATSR